MNTLIFPDILARISGKEVKGVKFRNDLLFSSIIALNLLLVADLVRLKK